MSDITAVFAEISERSDARRTILVP
jgi:hypothetical protein